MNDEFLHKIRVEPPPEFLARLKSRLDLQPPPTTPRKHSTRAKLVAGLLLCGGVFAMTLLMLNRGTPDTAVNSEPTVQQEPVAPTPASTASAKSAPVTAKETRSVKKEIPPNFTTITSKSLQPYMSHLTDTYFKPRGKVTRMVVTDSPTETLAQWCRDLAPSKTGQPGLVIALVARHMTPSDSDACVRNVGGTSETAVGYQALVLARSKLYGTFNLTPAELFMALAADVPDPARPDQLIPNPNTTWNDINGALEREPIEIIGPERSSIVGLALREILLEDGCRSIPSLANVKECPGLRSDGAYTEVTNPYDIAQQLQIKPNALGIVPYGTTQYAATVVIGPLAGVIPSMKNIANGTYPGARSLYLYMNSFSGGKPTTDYISAALPNDSFNLQQLAIIPPERSQP
jgi:ABC-type phosphate transport system substrate-binding protein